MIRMTSWVNILFIFISGFLSTGDSNAPGNYAILDQVAALHWLKENIAAFGGDPSEVTLLGQGYGGAMVNLLLISPVTKGEAKFSCNNIWKWELSWQPRVRVGICTGNKQRVLMHRHQGWNVRHGLCHIYMRYLYIYELFIAFVCFVVCSLL